MNAKFIILILALFLVPFAAHARPTAMKEQYNLGGYITIGKTTPYKFEPHSNPRPLPPMPSHIKSQNSNKIITDALSNYLVKFPATTGLLLIDHGQILMEEYQGKGTPTSEFYSMSIGKSMTSLALGKLLCSGAIPNLDITANTLIPELGNSSYGKSTIRQLLTMSSGAYAPIKRGQPGYKDNIGKNPRTGKPYSGEIWPIRLGQVTIEDVLWGTIWNKVFWKPRYKPGEKFQYKAGDTLTVSKIIEVKSGASTAAYFDKMIWQNIRGANSGHWEADRNGSTIANAGFQVALKDWGRIALWILDSLESQDCYSRYLKKATTTQINIPTGHGTYFQGYGYQWWIHDPMSSSFWGLGYAGQILAIHPPSGKVMIKFSYRKDPGSSAQLRKIFKQWVKAQ
ncbi:MAG: serine hydrolase [Sneathiella sp.]